MNIEHHIIDFRKTSNSATGCNKTVYQYHERIRGCQTTAVPSNN